ncbi:MAG: hypothetical protein HY075_01825 [Deltaproteobacteria bacterium]|nr:hypothetical protein [Deltaproteobacteria bacterium]
MDFRGLALKPTLAAATDQVLVGIDEPRRDHAAAGIDGFELQARALERLPVNLSDPGDLGAAQEDRASPQGRGGEELAVFDEKERGAHAALGGAGAWMLATGTA